MTWSCPCSCLNVALSESTRHVFVFFPSTMCLGSSRYGHLSYLQERTSWGCSVHLRLLSLGAMPGWSRKMLETNLGFNYLLTPGSHLRPQQFANSQACILWVHQIELAAHAIQKTRLECGVCKLSCVCAATLEWNLEFVTATRCDRLPSSEHNAGFEVANFLSFLVLP